MEKIYIGTSGYYYSDWKGTFYPGNMGKDDFLEYYVQFFNFVELNFSYYQKVKRILIAFNNHYKGQAIQNAETS